MEHFRLINATIECHLQTGNETFRVADFAMVPVKISRAIWHHCGMCLSLDVNKQRYHMTNVRGFEVNSDGLELELGSGRPAWCLASLFILGTAYN